MNSLIKSTVENCRKLHLQLNKGERHRITRDGVGRGSLWVTPRVECFCVCPTGEVEQLLYGFLRAHYGPEAGVDQNKKYWNIEESADVAQVIRYFDDL
jgi:hypothetical protein